MWGRVGAEFASMPHRRAVYCTPVNRMSGMRDLIHRIRLPCEAKGLCRVPAGHVAQQLDG
ncbi:hypothetical protein DY218_04330 [Streptomyces triticagri]|uniref:Uncharacterized protein n=1 Tax=Streptomyces triticagri TaxID=2293568 RepID=A0A372MC91_9ACTN|nr:hypothetical protein DY218_04330 [Streptomyces triticagri]